MTHCYEKNIVEIKNEYTTFLCNIITPLLYEGIKSLYNYALDTHKKLEIQGTSPGALKLFQTYLKEVPTLNSHQLEKEANRIKNGSRCGEWFDDLVKAVVKSNIVLLTFTTKKDESFIVKQRYHEQVDTKNFIHKCYIESAREIYNNPELFWHDYPALEIKRNQRETCQLIKNGIKEAIRKQLPIKLILQEYLKNDYTDGAPDKENVSHKMSDNQYINMKHLVSRDMHGAGVPREPERFPAPQTTAPSGSLAPSAPSAPPALEQLGGDNGDGEEAVEQTNNFEEVEADKDVSPLDTEIKNKILEPVSEKEDDDGNDNLINRVSGGGSGDPKMDEEVQNYLKKDAGAEDDKEAFFSQYVRK